MNNYILIILLIIILYFSQKYFQRFEEPFDRNYGMSNDDIKYYMKRLEFMKKVAYGQVKVKDGKEVKGTIGGVKSDLFMKAAE